jgi:alkylhydroperoxidase family enzyme
MGCSSSSPRARRSQSQSRSTWHDPSVSRQRAQDATVARLQALLPADSREPRIAPARPRELRPLARIIAGLAGRVTPGGPPNIFTTLGQHPRLFRAWLRYSAHLMPFGQLPRRETELVILRVAWQCRSAYEWHQHVPIALRVGLSPDEVSGVANSPPVGSFSERERALLGVSDELLARRALSDTTWSAVQATLGNREAIELCLLIGNYQGLASTIGGLAIQIESPPASQTKELEHRMIDRIRQNI